jgi:hypothetical protein
MHIEAKMKNLLGLPDEFYCKYQTHKRYNRTCFVKLKFTENILLKNIYFYRFGKNTGGKTFFIHIFFSMSEK